MAIKKDELLNPNVDAYLNPWLPRNRLDLLPKPIQRFLGYRSQPHVEPPLVVQWCLTFIASVAGICFVGGVFNNAPGIVQYHPPALIASLGASAVLDYNAIRSPLAQPRNAILGNTLSSICGVAVSKGFQHYVSFHRITWVSGAFACATASLVMSITGTVHPPGGATAVIASVEPAAAAMGWIYVPLVLLSSVMMQTVALLFNNTLRQYPVWWWSPGEVGSRLWGAKRDQDEEKALGNSEVLALPEPRALSHDTDSQATLYREPSAASFPDDIDGIYLSAQQIRISRHIKLSEQDLQLLQTLQNRLKPQ